MAGDELLCRIPKMAEVGPAVQPICVRDGVSLDHSRHGHIDVGPACSTCNIMQKDITDSLNHTVLDNSAEILDGFCQRRWMVKGISPFASRETRERSVCGVKDQMSATVRGDFNDFKVDLRRIWRFHTDRCGEFFKFMGHWLREIRSGTAEGYVGIPQEGAGRCHIRLGFQSTMGRGHHIDQRSQKPIEAKRQRLLG